MTSAYLNYLENVNPNLENFLFEQLPIPRHYMKRVKYECKTLLSIVTNFQVSQNTNRIVLSFRKKNNGKNIHYSFIIREDYPFKCPEIIVNGAPKELFMKLYLDTHVKFLKEWKGIECFCCQSIFCSENWGPIISFKQIIKEIENIIQIKGGLVMLILIEKIKKQYLISDINLFWWLY